MSVRTDIIILSVLQVILTVKAGTPTNHSDESFIEKRLEETLSSL
jgi:hypothetical protein